MPIRVPEGLPAIDELSRENIFVMGRHRALSQDIRPLRLIVLNLMPLKLVTELQLLRLLGNTPLQVDVEFLQTGTHRSKNVSKDHLDRFYRTIDDVEGRRYDGLIVTGAPVERLPFEQVDYWPELVRILDWAAERVWSSLFICWGAQAAMWHYHGIPKRELPGGKLVGVFEHEVVDRSHPLVRGFDDRFRAPHSRYTGNSRADIEASPLDVLAVSAEAGVYLAARPDLREVYITGHGEYERETLDQEYHRDQRAGLDPAIPRNYYPGDDPDRTPEVTWRGHSQLLFANWLNLAVYQNTPFDWLTRD